MIPPTGIALDAIVRLTDDTGIIQHSRFDIADRNHGYCVDDNARALMLMAIAKGDDDSRYERMAKTYAAFVEHAWNTETRAFRNFMGYDRRWLEDTGSLDSNGRTLWALASVEFEYGMHPTGLWAATLSDQVLGAIDPIASPRTAAFLILAHDRRIAARGKENRSLKIVRLCAQYLLGLHENCATTEWNWFEPYLAYDNYRLPQALIVAGKVLEKDAFLKAGCDALMWLSRRQTGPNGIFRPVSTAEFGVEHATPQLYDQQPIEAWAAIDAAIAAHGTRATASARDHAHAAYGWFTGANDAGEPVADAASGECCDGIGAGGINLNRGAESVLAWQFAQRRIITLRSLDIC